MTHLNLTDQEARSNSQPEKLNIDGLSDRSLKTWSLLGSDKRNGITSDEFIENDSDLVYDLLKVEGLTIKGVSGICVVVIKHQTKKFKNYGCYKCCGSK